MRTPRTTTTRRSSGPARSPANTSGGCGRHRMPAASLRRGTPAGLAGGTIAAAALTHTPPETRDRRLNIVVILTDDQSFDTLPSDPAAMPWLQSQILEPGGHWLWFPNAFIQTPLCCPSRATILSGRYSG